MSAERTAYHLIFDRLLEERKPANVTLQFEVPLSIEPQQADVIIVRKKPDADVSDAQVLRKLWPLISRDAVLEYKSPVRPVRRGDISRLLGYGAQYHTREAARLSVAKDLVLLLVVASLTPTLDEGLGVFEWERQALGDGYYRVKAQPYSMYVAVVDEVAESERDALLALLGHRTIESDEGEQWLIMHTIGSTEGAQMDNMEGYEELIEKLYERRPSLRKRLIARSPAAERLEGMRAEELILALDDDRLAKLAPELLETLSAEAREEIKRRMARH